jgi:hypothetical protein
METFESTGLGKVTPPAEENTNAHPPAPEYKPQDAFTRPNFDWESHKRTRREELHKQWVEVETPAGAHGFHGKSRGAEQATRLTPENILWHRIHRQVSRLVEQGGVIESFNLSLLTGELTIQGAFGVREKPVPQPHEQIQTAPGSVTWRIMNDLTDVSVLDLLGAAAELLDCLEPPAKAGIQTLSA